MSGIVYSIFLLFIMLCARARLRCHQLKHDDRETEVLKAIANGFAVRCRKRKEQQMIDNLKLLHAKRQEENRKMLSSRKLSSWSRIETTKGMVAVAKNFRSHIHTLC
jgi:hypothetical protein